LVLLLQIIKDKEDYLSQLVATANALVSKERSLTSELNRIRRDRQEHLLQIRFVPLGCSVIGFVCF
jgi:hypothetical protein